MSNGKFNTDCIYLGLKSSIKCDILHSLTWRCGRADGRFSNNQNFLDAKPNFITHGTPQSLRESTATGSIRINKKATEGLFTKRCYSVKCQSFERHCISQVLQSKKHYNRRPVKEVTFSKTGDKTRGGRLRHNHEFEIEIKLCNTTNRWKNSIILYYLCLYDDRILTKPV